MSRFFAVLCCALVVTGLACGCAQAVGEDILAQTGQYTFFVKPNPCVPVTYYQRTVPCRVKVPVASVRPREVAYHLPVPVIEGRKTMIRETPIACPGDYDPCVQCFPKESRRPGMSAAVVPHPVRVRFTELDIIPRCVTRRVHLPRWFMVEEIPQGRFGKSVTPAHGMTSQR